MSLGFWRTSRSSWPVLGRVQRQAQLFGEMLERAGVDPGLAARECHGQAFAVAARRCLACGHADECRRWLDGASAEAVPAFCPNADYLRRVKA